MEAVAERETTASSPLGDGALATMTPDQVDRHVAQVTQAVTAKRRIIKAALAACYPHDWADMGGKPYLEGEGAERLATVVGISFTTPIFNETKIGDDVFVVCMLEATWNAAGHTVCEIGSANTRDKLWDNSEERCLLAQFRETAGGDVALARRMLVGHVSKKALQNAKSRVVSAVMGIKGLKWPDLAELGFTRDKAGARVPFRKGATNETVSAGSAAAAVVSIDIMLTSGKGSRIATGGTITAAHDHTKFHKYCIKDKAASCNIIQWKNDELGELPAFAKLGAVVFFPEIEIREYQGSPQYVATASPEPVESTAGE